jgi:crotonobetainyl-CoA:carnitine CoA-transferase CaiB-like acyl-CoA transferase
MYILGLMITMPLLYLIVEIGEPLLRAHAKAGLTAGTPDFDVVIEQFNRNKRDIAIDLRTDAGHALLERLVVDADVFLTSYLPSTRVKLRIDTDDVFAVNPNVVYARGHGQGQRGPDADMGGFDSVSFWSRGGVGHMLSPPGGPLVMQRAAQGDGPSGMFLAGGIAAALFERARTGKGVVVDVSLLAGAVWTMAPDIVASSVLGTEPPRTDVTRARMSPLIGPYRTADDRWLMLNMLDGPKYWDQACRALTFDDWVGHPDNNTSDHKPRFTETIATRPIAEWDARLRAEGCIFSKMATPLEVLDDVQVTTLDYVPRHPTHATGRLASSPVQFDDEPVVITRGEPEVGEHTRDILGELGLPAAEIDTLAADGVIVAS